MEKISKKLAISLIFVLAFALTASLAIAKKGDNIGGGNKSEKTSQSKGKSLKEFKNFEKASKANSNAAIHKKKTAEVSDNLEEVAEEEKKSEEDVTEEVSSSNSMTTEEVSDDVEEVADEVEKTNDDTVEAIEKVESRNKFKKLLIGSDYKNLGQLRSSLVHNRNQIRKLTKLSGKVQNEESESTIEEQLVTLMQERERIKAVIQENESGFSILGWIVKFLSGYSEDSINEEEEQQLEEEVLDTLEEESDENEGTEGTEEDEENNENESDVEDEAVVE